MSQSTFDVIVHTDGACSGNPGPGGWAAVLSAGQHTRFVLPQAHVVDAAQIVAAAVEEAQEDVAPRDLPDWVYESRDPRIVMLREQSGPDYAVFQELRGAGAWQQALLMQEMRAERKARTGAGDDLEARVFAAYADHAASRRVPLPSQLELAQLGGDWEPSGEDIKLARELKGEEERASALVSEDAEREDDWGFEKAQWMPDPIGQLLLAAGRETIPATPALDQAYQHLDKLFKQHGDLLDAAAWAHDYLYQHLYAVDGELLADIMAITAKADALQGEIDAARAQHANRATAATSQQRTQGLAYIKDNWLQIAAAAWGGYQLEGRGVTVVDCLKTFPVATGLGHAILYVPLHHMPPGADYERRMATAYDPEIEVVVTLVQASSEDTYRVVSPKLTPQAAYAQQSEVKH